MIQREQPQDTVSKREVIVVLGVGRSGTSLAMQALETLGARVSENMIPPNVSNPKGFYEDADIVEIHKHLLSKLAPNASMPLQEGWLNTPQAKQALEQLKVLVEEKVKSGGVPWAFKDPRTATFLPLWTRLFNQLKIVPRFVVAIRNPEAIIESFAVQYGNDQAFAELIFLQRTLDALHYTGSNCHLLSYDSWFRSPQKTLQQLAEYIFDQPTVVGDKKPPVSPDLNRSQNANVQVRNPLVNELYEHMNAFEKKPENRGALMACVERQRRVLESFRPWWTLAANQMQSNIRYREQLNDADSQKKQHKTSQQQLKRKIATLEQYQQAFSDAERLYQILE